MALGDDALNAGMDIVLPTDDRRNGADEITRTRDYLAQRLAALGSAAQFNAAQSATPNTIPRRWADGTLTGPDPVSPGGYTPRQYVDAAVTAARAYTDSKVGSVDLSSRVAKTGDTMTGNLGFDGSHIIVPAAYAATASYTVAYINGDGRLSRGASSERYKKYISTIDPADLGDIWPDLVRYQMRSGDGEWKYGYIAERLAESDELHPFVVYRDIEGESLPDSIDFIALLIAQNAQLHQRLSLLEQRIGAEDATH